MHIYRNGTDGEVGIAVRRKEAMQQRVGGSWLCIGAEAGSEYPELTSLQKGTAGGLKT